MISFEEYKEKALKDPAVKKAYDDLREEYDIEKLNPRKNPYAEKLNEEKLNN